MSETRLDLLPQNLWEGWFAYVVDRSKTRVWATLCLLMAIFLFAMSFLMPPGLKWGNLFFWLGVIWFFVTIIHFERNAAYNLLKRQQDEIDRLKKACLSHEPT